MNECRCGKEDCPGPENCACESCDCEFKVELADNLPRPISVVLDGRSQDDVG